MHVVGGQGDVEAGVGDGDDVAKLREGHEIGSRMDRVQGCALRMAQHIQLTDHPGWRFITVSTPALYRMSIDINTALFGRLYIYQSLNF
ncbi:hypothetical protein GCM10007862_00530 [Dyella lipolytica]|nr:hypothetical protein GCM10007862_00530 [Dyella lipolytica]